MTSARNHQTWRVSLFGGTPRGAAAVEFALVAVPALFLILVTFQVILVTTARIALDSAVHQIASDAANADPAELADILTRDNLCAKTAFSLVNCSTDKRFCFSVRTMDPAASTRPPVNTCMERGIQIIPTGCCYEIRIEYPVPLALDFIRVFLAPISQNATLSMIRSIALVYRA